jgi:hypothetical protein
MTVRDIVMAASGVGGAPAATDPQFNYVTMLLHGDGTNGAQNNTFLDSSTNNFTITRTGTPTQGSFSPYGDLWSNFFSGSQYLTVPAGSAFAYGTGNFTVEGWFFATTSLPQYGATLFSQTVNGTNYFWCTLGDNTISPANKVCFTFATSGGGTAITSGSSTYVNNTWNHFAIVRNSGVVTVYLNGVGGTPTACTQDFSNTTYVPTIGRYTHTDGNNFTGYLSNLRVVKGTALYTSNFTPSTTPLTAVSGTSLLTCQSNRFRDNSSNNFAITVTGTPSVQRFSPFDPAAEYSTSVIGGSGFFNGTTDFVTAPNSAALQLSNGNFTIEFWFYATNLTGARQFLNTDTSVPNTSYAIVTSGTTCLYYLSSTGTTWNLAGGVSAGTVTANTWNHLALVRNGATVTPYINGVAGTTTSVGTTALHNFTSALGIGQASSQYFAGYLSSLRIVKGTAVYTSAFTPPTAPLTAITNTSLLLNTVNAGIFDNAMMNDLVTVGNAQVSTAVKKYGTGSMAFDGTGDWLTFIDTPNVQFGTGDFTIEGWVYLSALGTARGFISKGTSTTGFSFGVNSLNQLVFSYTATSLTAITPLIISTWYYVAVVRSGSASGNLKIYLNGSVDATSGGAVNDNFNQTSIGYVGADRVATSPMNGYIDDLRITKGIARTITTPTAAFPNN